MAPARRASNRSQASEARLRRGSLAGSRSRATSSQPSTASGSRYTTSSRRSSQLSGPQNTRRYAYSQRSAPLPKLTSVAPSRTFADGTDLIEKIDATNEHPRELNEDDDTLCEVFMALNMQENGTVGCAYYVARSETLYFMEDVHMGGADVVEALKLFTDPTVILLPSKCNDVIFARLDPESNDPRASVDGRSADQTRLPYLLECRPNTEFGFDAARSKLVNLRIGQADGPVVTFVVPGDVVISEDAYADGEGRASGGQAALLRLAGWIDTESRLTVGCAGAVLTYLQRRRNTAYLPHDRAAAAMFRVAKLEMFTLSGSVYINADTLLSLQITSTESHPNAQNQGPAGRGWSSSGGAKEGLSVYGLFHHLAKTSQGRVLLRQYFLRPSMNIEVIDERLNTIAVLLQPNNLPLLDELTQDLAKIKNMRIITTNLRRGINSGIKRDRSVSTSVWPMLRQFVFFALKIFDRVCELEGAESLSIRAKILRRFDKQAMAAVGMLIGDIVDFQATQEQRRTVVCSGVDAELDEMKRTYDGIEPFLFEVSQHVAATVPAELDAKINVIYFPQIGFLISCAKDVETGASLFNGPPHDEWESMFITESQVYFKNSNMKEMDDAFGDIYGRICDREIEIVQDLSEKVLESEVLLNDVSDICGELDSLVALARGAKQHNLVRPRLTEENVVHITGGRHPLQELAVPSFVPNNTNLVGGLSVESAARTANKVLHQAATSTQSVVDTNTDTCQGPGMVLMTGPNYSGKSVYLKQVAIIVYMAHVGSFVPAEAARIGLTDKILTRISTRESVSRIQSAFMIDLQQISIALNLATRRSLVIIDEFGKGTESYDGAGLAAGVFEHLLQRGTECPKVIGATHFHEIFECGFLKPRPSLGFAHMEVRMDTHASSVENQIVYLYNYRHGRSTSSFGTICAAMNGIEPAVIEKADELLLLAARGVDLVETCAELPNEELFELEQAERLARQFLCADVRECQPRKLVNDLIAMGSSTDES